MAVLKEVLALFDVQVRGAREMQRTNASGQRLTQTLGRLGTALSAGAIVAGVNAFTRSMVNAGDELDKASRQVGLSVAELQQWRFAADRAGVDAAAMTQSLVRLQRAAFDASRGTGESADAFNRLGIDVNNSEGQLKSGSALLFDMARTLNQVESSTEQVALAQTLMGRSGARLLPLFADGEEGVSALAERFQQLGGGLSEDTVAAAAEAQDALTDLGIAQRSLENRMAIFLIPMLTRTVLSVTNFASGLAHLSDESNLAQAVLITLGVVAAAAGVAALIAWAPVVLTVAAIIAAFAAVVLVVDDLIALFTGGRSKIAEFLDEMFGAGTAAQLVLDLSEAWWDVVDAASAAFRAVQRALGVDVADDAAERQAEQRRRNERRRRLSESVRRARRGARTETEREGTADETLRNVGLRSSRTRASFPIQGGIGQLLTERARISMANSRGGSVDARQINNINVGSDAQASDITRRLQRERDRQARTVRSATSRGAP